MYLPKSKYKEPKYTQGLEFTDFNRKPYVGWYFETYKEEFYSGKEPSTGNRRLFPIQADSTVNNIDKFTPQIITPTPSDYLKGDFIRYFLQDKRTKKIIEVKKEKYNLLLDKTYITGTTVNWVLKKPAENIFVDKYMYEGAISRNKKSVIEAEKLLPTLSNYIKAYDQFVE